MLQKHNQSYCRDSASAIPAPEDQVKQFWWMENALYPIALDNIADDFHRALYDDDDQEQHGIASESWSFALNGILPTVSAQSLLLRSDVPVAKSEMLPLFGDKLFSRHEAHCFLALNSSSRFVVEKKTPERLSNQLH